MSEISISKHETRENAEAAAAAYRFTVARLCIEQTRHSLQQNPAYTQALAERLFSSVNGIPNDRNRPTCFSQDGIRYSVGYQYESDDYGSWTEGFTVGKHSTDSEEHIVLEARRYLPYPTAPRFLFDGVLEYRRDGKDISTTIFASDPSEYTPVVLEELRPDNRP